MDAPARRNGGQHGFAALWELIVFKTLADLRAERERTYLGFVWWFVEPMLFMAVLVVVVDVVGLRGGPGFVPFLLSGLVLWLWYKSAVSHGMTSVMQAAPLLRNVHVPPAVFVIVTLLSDTIKFLLVLLVLMLVLWAYGNTPHLGYAALPPLLLSLMLLIGGVTMILAATVPFLPDLRFVVEAVLQAQFFLSGIFYSLDRVPDEYRVWLQFNPMAVYIDAARDILLEDRAPSTGPLMLWSLAGAILFLCGLQLTRVLASRYPKLPS